MSSYKDLRIVDNFYQTSAFFPMPTILVGTLTDDGKTTFGPYSLCQPYYIAGKEYYAMLLCCRNSSNTAQNILKHKKCSLNFIYDDKRLFKEAVRMGFPGDTPEEKMKDCIYTLEDGLRKENDPDGTYPQVIQECFQVFECTWVDTLDNAQDDKAGELNEKQYNAIVNGVKASAFPRVPVDYGYRDSKNFWYTKFRRPIPELLPVREGSLDSVKYAANRIDPDVKFTDEACMKMIKVPRIFLPTALKGCVEWAKENNVTLITAEHMDIINDKRAKEKQK